MANNAKVMDSIKSFLLKMKANDENIPEELAQDACEMVEAVKDALCECDEVIEEKKPEQPENNQQYDRNRNNNRNWNGNKTQYNKQYRPNNK